MVPNRVRVWARSAASTSPCVEVERRAVGGGAAVVGLAEPRHVQRVRVPVAVGVAEQPVEAGRGVPPGQTVVPRYRLLCDTRGLLPRTPLYYYYVVICSCF